MSRDHASAEERFRCLYAEHVDPIQYRCTLSVSVNGVVRGQAAELLAPPPDAHRFSRSGPKSPPLCVRSGRRRVR